MNAWHIAMIITTLAMLYASYTTGYIRGQGDFELHEINYDAVKHPNGLVVKSGPRIFVLPEGYDQMPSIDYAIRHGHIKAR